MVKDVRYARVKANALKASKEKPWVLVDVETGQPLVRHNGGWFASEWSCDRALWFRDRDDFTAWRVALELTDPYHGKRHGMTIVRRTWWRRRWWRAVGAFKQCGYIPGFLLKRICWFVGTLVGLR